MEERTRAYLRGRFRDHYRRSGPDLPPDASEREWGYIPWTEGPDTTMVRHRSLLDLGEIGDFLERERPRHVYFSAGRYDDPSAGAMSEKGWRGSDLIFDLDADHLPGVTPGEDTYAEMLDACKDALFRLLDFLENDFGFEDLTVVFSGGRGYHVHVRDAGVQGLERESRREIVDYVRGIGLDFDALVTTTRTAGGVSQRVLDTEGGWAGRTHRNLLGFFDDLDGLNEDDAHDRLQKFDGVGEQGAAAVYNAVTNSRERLEAGNVELGGPAMRKLVRTIGERTAEEEHAPIDEPVTTDTNRLIRLPGSLHGGSGLEVRRLDRAALDGFDPLADAIPETFVGHEITVFLPEDRHVELGEISRTLGEGTHTVPEYVGVFLMARGWAEKDREQ